MTSSIAQRFEREQSKLGIETVTKVRDGRPHRMRRVRCVCCGEAAAPKRSACLGWPRRVSA